jgi:hypothetical protein
MWLSKRLTPQTPDMCFCRRCAIGRRKRYGFWDLPRPRYLCDGHHKNDSGVKLAVKAVNVFIAPLHTTNKRRVARVPLTKCAAPFEPPPNTDGGVFVHVRQVEASEIGSNR